MFLAHETVSLRDEQLKGMWNGRNDFVIMSRYATPLPAFMAIAVR